MTTTKTLLLSKGHPNSGDRAASSVGRTSLLIHGPSVVGSGLVSVDMPLGHAIHALVIPATKGPTVSTVPHGPKSPYSKSGNTLLRTTSGTAVEAATAVGHPTPEGPSHGPGFLSANTFVNAT